MSTQNNLQELINQIVDEKTLSSEAFKRLYEVKDQHENLVRENEELKKSHEAEILRLQKEIKEKTDLAQELVAREIKQEDLNKRERELEIKEAVFKVKEEVDGKSGQLVIRMFETVFANVSLRKQLNRSIPGHTADNGNWVSEYCVSDSEETKEE